MDTEIQITRHETASEAELLIWGEGGTIISANTLCKKQTLSKMGFMESLNDFRRRFFKLTLAGEPGLC